MSSGGIEDQKWEELLLDLDKKYAKKGKNIALWDPIFWRKTS